MEPRPMRRRAFDPTPGHEFDRHQFERDPDSGLGPITWFTAGALVATGAATESVATILVGLAMALVMTGVSVRRRARQREWRLREEELARMTHPARRSSPAGNVRSIDMYRRGLPG